jgi:hypothetical protein
VKSFTGVLWDSGAWSSRAMLDLSGDAKSETSAPSVAAKQNPDSSAVASEKSNSGDGGTPVPAIVEAASSPAVAAA